MKRMTEKEAIELVGAGLVDKVNSINCEPTNRVYDGMDGETEWSASVKLPDELGERLGADCLVIIYITDNEETEKIDEVFGGDASQYNWDDNYYIIR